MMSEQFNHVVDNSQSLSQTSFWLRLELAILPGVTFRFSSQQHSEQTTTAVLWYES